MSYAQLNEWSLSIRRLVAEIDSPQVLRTLIDELAGEVIFDTWFMAVFYRDGPPFILDYFGMGERQETYAEGPYLLDPYYNAYLAGVGHGCFSLRQLAPDDFAKTQYYRTYYRHIGVSDEIGYILPFDQRSAGHVSLCRTAALPRFFRPRAALASGRRAGRRVGDAPPLGRPAEAGADASVDRG